MMKNTAKDTHHGTVTSYIIGFALSVAFTLLAFYIATSNGLARSSAFLLIIILAVAQLLVQLFFFLHMGKESKPRWNLMMFYFMVGVIGIIVIGSLWIMHNLDYNMMPEHNMDQHMIEESNKGF